MGAGDAEREGAVEGDLACIRRRGQLHLARRDPLPSCRGERGQRDEEGQPERVTSPFRDHFASSHPPSSWRIARSADSFRWRAARPAIVAPRCDPWVFRSPPRPFSAAARSCLARGRPDPVAAVARPAAAVRLRDPPGATAAPACGAHRPSAPRASALRPAAGAGRAWAGRRDSAGADPACAKAAPGSPLSRYPPDRALGRGEEQSEQECSHATALRRSGPSPRAAAAQSRTNAGQANQGYLSSYWTERRDSNSPLWIFSSSGRNFRTPRSAPPPASKAPFPRAVNSRSPAISVRVRTVRPSLSFL